MSLQLYIMSLSFVLAALCTVSLVSAASDDHSLDASKRDARSSGFAFAKRPQFAFAKRARFAFAKRPSFAFAKRANFAFAKRPNFAFAKRAQFAFAKRDPELTEEVGLVPEYDSEEVEDEEVSKRSPAQFAFAKRSMVPSGSALAFAKRSPSSSFAFAKRST